ncbi:META domain-containing protein [Roseobacter weihaiensis]|uniref:META domain-containing protein n=1 Tax=Roseobacter weihaiensis TaxID=2763262 RepID=UPI001D0B02C0|nr:META domain-containing protein [Roseobacter sp. H9]
MAALTILSACKRDETVAGYGAAGQVWHVTEIDGVPFAANATLTFPEPGRIAGKAPCNAYSASMTAPYPWFEVETIAATRALCPDSAAEEAYFEALTDMTLSEVLGTTLILSTPEGRKIILQTGG